MLAKCLRISAAASLLCILPSALAAYRHQGFGALYTGADAIVLGEIVAVADETYSVRIDEVLRASTSASVAASHIIKVQRFHNWKCAARWKAYAKGQRLLLFLGCSGENHSSARVWHALGAAVEGEMPIEGGFVFVGASGDGSFIDERHIVYGSSYPSRRFALSTVLAALRSGSLPPDLLRAPLGRPPSNQ